MIAAFAGAADFTPDSSRDRSGGAMRFGIAKSTNSRERARAACSTCTDSEYFASRGSACRFSLLTFAGFETRPSTKRSSVASSLNWPTSAAERRFLIFRNTAGRRDLSDVRCGIRAVERSGRGDDPRDRGAFLRRQAWAPYVADQYVARLVAVVPGFVLDGVVEDPGMTDAPFPDFAAHPEPAARRHEKRQMHDQPAARAAAMPGQPARRR